MKTKSLTALLCAALCAAVFTSCSSGSGLPYDKYDLDDYIDPGDYKSVSVSEDDIDSEVSTQISAMLSANTIKNVITDRGAQEGDVVNIDYSGYIEGELIPNGSDTGFDLTIGSGSFVPGFEEGLIGAKTGETVEVNLNYPDEYKLNPDYAGKPAMFVVKINEISTQTIPELTDEFIASVYPSYPTVATYRDALRENVRMTLMWQAVLERVSIISYPEEEITAYYSSMVNRFTENAAANNMTLEEMVTNYYMMSLDDFYAQAMQAAQSQIASEMALYSIAEKEGITVNDLKYQETALQLALNNGASSVEELVEQYGEETVMTSVMRKLVIDYLADNAGAESDTAA